MGCVDAIKCEKWSFEFNTFLPREPVVLLKKRSDMIKYKGFGDNASNRVLNQLELMEDVLRKNNKR